GPRPDCGPAAGPRAEAIRAAADEAVGPGGPARAAAGQRTTAAVDDKHFWSAIGSATSEADRSYGGKAARAAVGGQRPTAATAASLQAATAQAAAGARETATQLRKPGAACLPKVKCSHWYYQTRKGRVLAALPEGRLRTRERRVPELRPSYCSQTANAHQLPAAVAVIRIIPIAVIVGPV